MTVALGTTSTKFSACLNNEGNIAVSGTVKSGAPFLTSVGNTDVDVVMEVSPSCLCPSDFPCALVTLHVPK